MNRATIREQLVAITMRNTVNGDITRELAEEAVDGLIADDESPFYACIKGRDGNDDEVRAMMRRVVAIYRGTK